MLFLSLQLQVHSRTATIQMMVEYSISHRQHIQITHQHLETTKLSEVVHSDVINAQPHSQVLLLILTLQHTEAHSMLEISQR